MREARYSRASTRAHASMIRTEWLDFELDFYGKDDFSNLIVELLALSFPLSVAFILIYSLSLWHVRQQWVIFIFIKQDYPPLWLGKRLLRTGSLKSYRYYPLSTIGYVTHRDYSTTTETFLPYSGQTGKALCRNNNFLLWSLLVLGRTDGQQDGGDETDSPMFNWD